MLGFASMLLALGTRNVIASVVAVPDAGAERLMRALHQALVRGQRPAPALASARGTLPASELPLTGFLSLGVG